MRFDTSNFKCSDKMYSVKGVATTGGDYDIVQCGMVGKIGARIVDDIYEFLPLAEGDTDVFFIATPEVDPDESSFEKNTLKGFTMVAGQTCDAIQATKFDNFTIEEAGIEGGAVAKTGYVYAVGGKRKLQYSATLPLDDVKAIMVAKIDDIVPATQGMFIMQGTGSSKGLNSITMKYNLVRCRIIK